MELSVEAPGSSDYKNHKSQRNCVEWERFFKLIVFIQSTFMLDPDSRIPDAAGTGLIGGCQPAPPHPGAGGSPVRGI